MNINRSGTLAVYIMYIKYTNLDGNCDDKRLRLRRIHENIRETRQSDARTGKLYCAEDERYFILFLIVYMYTKCRNVRHCGRDGN